MAADSENTSKVVVQTYLPEYQRDEWDTHAEELGMSRSEFVKTMVQAGRRGFEGVTKPDTEPTPPAPSQEPVAEAEGHTKPPGTLRETVVDALSADDYRSWDELLATVTDDIESQLEDALQELQADNRVRYSGRHGGYTLDS